MGDITRTIMVWGTVGIVVLVAFWVGIVGGISTSIRITGAVWVTSGITVWVTI